jgi:hypothetical protein
MLRNRKAGFRAAPQSTKTNWRHSNPSKQPSDTVDGFYEEAQAEAGADKVGAAGDARRHTKRYEDSSHILIQASGIVKADISFLVVMCFEGKKGNV